MPTKTFSLPTQFTGATTLHAVFARVSQQFPHNIAVTDGQTQLTYRDLNERAEKLAISLLNIGVKRDQLVGLCLECTCDLIIGILGILKAGGAYVPLDPAHPQERRKQIAQLSTMDIVVADDATAPNFEDRTVVNITAAFPCRAPSLRGSPATMRRVWPTSFSHRARRDSQKA